MAEARDQVRAAITAWDVPVDPDVAVLLTSELVTNAIQHEAGETITLFITCYLRPPAGRRPRHLALLPGAAGRLGRGRDRAGPACWSTRWRPSGAVICTPEGKAVYFTLGFRPDPAAASGRGPARDPDRKYRNGKPAVPARPRNGTLLRFPRRSPRCDGPQG